MNVAGSIRSRPTPLSDVKRRGNADGTPPLAMTDVDMYMEVPSFELSLDEFEEYALARLKVCRLSLTLYEAVVLFVVMGSHYFFTARG